ncbi:MAG: ogr/Delta-like zinc finger family protein [Oceanospirillaceae bacterium]|nr:ogr/Delta-like zinc finger family protein [Oceanospirillaceae bacterium]
MSGSVYKHQCPDCGHAVRVRNSTGLSALVRACYLQCLNLGCGATFKATTEITHRLSPPAIPNPAIHLPMADLAMLKCASGDSTDNQLDFDELLEPH